jgi:hypothetical protein
VEQQSDEEEEKGRADEKREEEVVEEAEKGKGVEVVEEEGEEDEIDRESEAEGVPREGRKDVAVAGDRVERLNVAPRSFGKRSLEEPIEERVEEEDASAAEKAQLKPEVGRDEGIPNQLCGKRAAEDIEAGRGAVQELSEEIEKGGEPTPLHCGRRADEEKIGVDGDEQSGDFPCAREE